LQVPEYPRILPIIHKNFQILVDSSVCPLEKNIKPDVMFIAYNIVGRKYEFGIILWRSTTFKDLKRKPVCIIFAKPV